MNTAFEFAEEFADRIKWHELGNMLVRGLNTAIEFWDADLSGSAIYKNLNGIMDIIYTFFTTTNWSNLGAKFATGLNTLFDGLDWDLLGRTFAAKWQALIDFLYDFVTKFDWKKFGTGIGTAINGWFDKIDWAKAGEALSNGVKGAIEFINSAIRETDWDNIGTRFGVFLKNIDWQGIMNEVGELIGNAFIAGIKLAWPTLKDVLWEIFIEPFASMPYWFEVGMNDAGENVVAGFFKGIWYALSHPSWIFDNFFAPFMASLQDAFQMHSPSKVMEEMGVFIVQGFANGISSTIQSVITIFYDMWTNIKTEAQEAWQGIVAIWSVVSEWFNTAIITPVSEFFSTCWENISEWASNSWDGIRGVWEAVAGWFDEHIITPLTNAFKGFVNTVNGFWQGLINGILGAFESLINSVIDGINNLLDMLPTKYLKKAGLDISLSRVSLPRIEIPALATGAVIPPNQEFLALLWAIRSAARTLRPRHH